MSLSALHVAVQRRPARRRSRTPAEHPPGHPQSLIPPTAPHTDRRGLENHQGTMDQLKNCGLLGLGCLFDCMSTSMGCHQAHVRTRSPPQPQCLLNTEYRGVFAYSSHTFLEALGTCRLRECTNGSASQRQDPCG